jgi:hypothetical protein
MKIRSSLTVVPMVAPVGPIAALPLPLVEPGLGYGDAAFWAIAGILAAAVALMGVIAIPFGVVKIEGPHIYLRGKHGWNRKRELAPGERLDLTDGRLRVRLADGTLDKHTYLPRWMANRRDWARLEAACGR